MFKNFIFNTYQKIHTLNAITEYIMKYNDCWKLIKIIDKGISTLFLIFSLSFEY